jgi:hypothetical protein
VRLARNLVFTTDSGVSIQLSSSGQIDGDKEVLLVSNLKELAEKGNMSGLLEEVAATVAHRAERSAAVGSTRDERTEEVFA